MRALGHTLVHRLCPPRNAPPTSLFHGEILVLRARLQDVSATDAVARYVPHRWPRGDSARQALQAIRFDLVRFADVRSRVAAHAQCSQHRRGARNDSMHSSTCRRQERPLSPALDERRSPIRFLWASTSELHHRCGGLTLGLRVTSPPMHARSPQGRACQSHRTLQVHRLSSGRRTQRRAHGTDACALLSFPIAWRLQLPVT